MDQNSLYNILGKPWQTPGISMGYQYHFILFLYYGIPVWDVKPWKHFGKIVSNRKHVSNIGMEWDPMFETHPWVELAAATAATTSLTQVPSTTDKLRTDFSHDCCFFLSLKRWCFGEFSHKRINGISFYIFFKRTLKNNMFFLKQIIVNHSKYSSLANPTMTSSRRYGVCQMDNWWRI